MEYVRPDQYEGEVSRATSRQTPAHNDQNWAKVNDYESVIEALDGSAIFESQEDGRTVSGENSMEVHPAYNPPVETASYEAEGFRVDVMPDYQDKGTGAIVRATVVDRETDGFQTSKDAYIEAISEADDIMSNSSYVDEVAEDIEDPLYSVGRETATDGGEMIEEIANAEGYSGRSTEEVTGMDAGDAMGI